MADDMGKINMSEPCVNISGYTARDGVSKSVTELTTTRQSLNQAVEGDVTITHWNLDRCDQSQTLGGTDHIV